MQSKLKETITTEEAINLEKTYGAKNYDPLEVVLARGEGVFVWDPEGNRYYDFLSAYSAVNQGHCNPRIIQALKEQAETLTLTSRAFYNNILGEYEKFITGYFGFDRVLPMNTGAEGVETAIKLARKWGYEKKGIPAGEARIVVCENNFHGRTISIISFSGDPEATGNFGPFTPGFITIPYNDCDALEQILKQDKHIAGFLVEPIQGEAGVNVPDDDFISRASALCRRHNVLLITDEIQTGIARTGSLLAVCGNCHCESHCNRQNTYTKPDILILGKALSGGVYPVSAVLADEEVMEVIQPGQHGSTFGGNPLACRVAIAALKEVREKNLSQKARKLGKLFRKKMLQLKKESGLIKEVRGRGLLNAIEINDTAEHSTARNICIALKKNGLLAKPTHGNIIRLAPPLIISEEQLRDCIDIIYQTFSAYEKNHSIPE